MNELAAPYVNADVVDAGTACGEEDQVAFFQILFRDEFSFVLQGFRSPGQLHAVFFEHVLDEGRAVKNHAGRVAHAQFVSDAALQALGRVDDAIRLACRCFGRTAGGSGTAPIVGVLRIGRNESDGAVLNHDAKPVIVFSLDDVDAFALRNHPVYVCAGAGLGPEVDAPLDPCLE